MYMYSLKILEIQKEIEEETESLDIEIKLVKNEIIELREMLDQIKGGNIEHDYVGTCD